jgi:sugar phosphate isomerase/epimerase
MKSATLAASAAFVMPELNILKDNPVLSLKASLQPGAIELNTNAQKIISQAHDYKFDAIAPLLEEIVSYSSTQVENYLDTMESHNLIFDAAGLPIQFRTNEETFKEGLDQLKSNLPILSKLNIPGFVTWIMPTNDSISYIENFELHKRRLKQVARLLSDYNMRLGLEYVGPKTLMARDKFAFIHTISELRILINSIQEDNVGYLLDAFHMYCSEDTASDYDFITANDIVSVQINDAISRKKPSQQMDLDRNLPGSTGVIDLKAFLSLIQMKGYKGCVSVEPFNKKVNEMDEKEKLQAVSNSIFETFKKLI